MSALGLTIAVHRALKGREWNVHFYRDRATGFQSPHRNQPYPVAHAKADLAFYVGNDKVRPADRMPWSFIALDG